MTVSTIDRKIVKPLLKKIGAPVVAFTGKKNSPLEDVSDVCLCLGGPTATVQEIHQVAYHVLCDLVEEVFA